MFECILVSKANQISITTKEYLEFSICRQVTLIGIFLSTLLFHSIKNSFHAILRWYINMVSVHHMNIFHFIRACQQSRAPCKGAEVTSLSDENYSFFSFHEY